MNVCWARHVGMPQTAACLLAVDTYTTLCHQDWSPDRLGNNWEYWQPVVVTQPEYLGTEKGLGMATPKQACTRCLVFSWPLALARELHFVTRIPEPQLAMPLEAKP